MDGLAKALADNDWVPSKTTDKTMAVMSGLCNIPWDKVKVFTLRWVDDVGEIVPEINLMMFGEGEKGEAELSIELPPEVQAKLDAASADKTDLNK